MVAAALAAFRASADTRWLEVGRIAFEWFTGRNDAQLALYDPQTGGCHDGLSVDRVNMNQGAESTLAYLSARIQTEALELLTLSVRPKGSISSKRKPLEGAATGITGLSGRRAPSGTPYLNS